MVDSDIRFQNIMKRVNYLYFQYSMKIICSKTRAMMISKCKKCDLKLKMEWILTKNKDKSCADKTRFHVIQTDFARKNWTPICDWGCWKCYVWSILLCGSWRLKVGAMNNFKPSHSAAIGESWKFRGQQELPIRSIE